MGEGKENQREKKVMVMGMEKGRSLARTHREGRWRRCDNLEPQSALVEQMIDAAGK